jgi:hypothetical protein
MFVNVYYSLYMFTEQMSVMLKKDIGEVIILSHN